MLRPSELPAIVDALATPGGGLGHAAEAARALRRAPGRGVVLPGSDLAPALQRRIAALNAEIGAPIRYLQPFWQWDGLTPRPVAELLERMAAGEIGTLIVLGANPLYELDDADALAAAMDRVPQRLHFGTERDETARACTWHGPLHHALEDWSDIRAVDGTVGLVQPLIAPLHDTRSAQEVLAQLASVTPAAAYDIVRATWRDAWGAAEFEERWLRSLHDGVVAGTGGATAPVAGSGAGAAATSTTTRAPSSVPSPAVSSPAVPPAAIPPAGAGMVEVLVRPSPTLYDGAFASNAWLQECPEPFTKQVWGNAVWIAPEDARLHGIADGDVVELSAEDTAAEGTRIVGPAIVLEGQAAGAATLTKGYGRSAAGPIGTGFGFEVRGIGARARLRKLGGKQEIWRTQTDFQQHGRDILKTVSSVGVDLQDGLPPPTFYGDWTYDDYAWGMVIDTDACIGCNACMIACQSENNIPVVGPDEIARGRNMHWIRVDTYLMETGGRGFQPVPCMHCEKAPCEPVCPVEASVHDGEGLNVQVYNRCIGTRFCQANCPYKVRRFNFFDYAGSDAFADQGADLLQALRNPDVSVRGRGVMEKCTYCVQRISSARREAKKADRRIGDGEVVTACQAACPAEAIRFGNLNDPGSAVRRAKAEPRHYALLGELGTRPRTTYLARVEPEEG